MDSREHVQQLVEYVLNIRFKDLPEIVVDRTKLAILDFFGNSLAALGTNHHLIAAVVDLTLESEGRKESTVLGVPTRISCLDAAMVHGVLGNFLDFSDGHFMGGHINDRIVPAALAAAERMNATGTEFITAVLAGYEAYVRLAYALFGKAEPASIKGPSFVVLGALGSTIAVGKLLSLTSEQMTGAMGLAASMQICSGQYTISGGHEKDLCPGHESRRAVLSALMAQKGVLGSKDILQGDRGLGHIAGGTLDLNRITEALGEKFMIEECYFKPYPACKYLHASIDAAIDIAKNNTVDAKHIREVKVTTNSSSARRSTYDIRSHVSAIFSHPYQVAVVLAEGKPDLPTSWTEKMQSGLIAELIRKIKVESSKEFDELYRTRTLDCGTWPSRVEVSMNNGHRFESTVLRPKGDPTNPMTNEELEGKFKQNAMKILGIDELDRLVCQIYQTEKIDDLRGFCQELSCLTVKRKHHSSRKGPH